MSVLLNMGATIARLTAERDAARAAADQLAARLYWVAWSDLTDDDKAALAAYEAEVAKR